MRKLVALAILLALVAAACADPEPLPQISIPPQTLIPNQTAPTLVTQPPLTIPPTTTTTLGVSIPPADTVFLNGQVVTMEPGVGTFEALAITDGVITFVGASAGVGDYVTAETTVIDLEGRTVIPGFVDPHTHILSDMGSIAEGQKVALRNGITSVGDASVEPELADTFMAADDAGELVVRTSMYLSRTDPCGEDLGPWYGRLTADAVFSDRLRVAGVKIFADGGTCGQLAVSQEWLKGYVDGEPFQDHETLTALVNEATANAYQVIVHAQGDLAIARVLDAYEEVFSGGPNWLRHRIDHGSFITPDIGPRFGELDVSAAVFGYSPACDADVFTGFYRDYGDRPNALSLANPEMIVAWHGDDPWLPPVSPLLDLYAMVTRNVTLDDGTHCEAAEWIGGAVTVEEGLAMMTWNAAYVLRQEGLVGSLAPDKLADLLVLSANPLEIDPEELPSVAVLMTMVGGRTEYCATAPAVYCP